MALFSFPNTKVDYEESTFGVVPYKTKYDNYIERIGVKNVGSWNES